ncbi:MAG: outer membrane protein transport protein, partial [Alistipes sp.]|nr:outer membrane protein transport protein [Alistipes sp.]
YYNSQCVCGQCMSTAYIKFNFHDIAFQLPLAKRVGLGFSLTPYSSVGYRTKYDHPYDPNDPVWGNVGRVQYNYQGEGDVTEVKVGIGWEIFKNFSVGIAAQYYWGDIDRDYVSTTTAIVPEGDATFSSIIGNDNYNISSIKGQVGVQWNAIMSPKRALTLGAAFDFGGNLNPKVTSTTYINNMTATTGRGDTTSLALVLPRQLSVGAYYQTAKWTVGLDYVYQNWGGRNKGTALTGVTGSGDDRTAYEVAYTNTSTVKIGVEFTPSRYDVRHFLKRWSYRAGFRYGNYNQSFNGDRLSQYAVTAGEGVPVKFLAISAVDVGFEYGRRGYNIAERV